MSDFKTSIERVEKAIEIIDSRAAIRLGLTWLVPSSSPTNVGRSHRTYYTVTGLDCTCEDRRRRFLCKHLWATTGREVARLIRDLRAADSLPRLEVAVRNHILEIDDAPEPFRAFARRFYRDARSRLTIAEQPAPTVAIAS